MVVAVQVLIRLVEMSQERIAYLDRKITELRREQGFLREDIDIIEREVCKYEEEADQLEAVVNEETYGGTCNDEG